MFFIVQAQGAYPKRAPHEQALASFAIVCLFKAFHTCLSSFGIFVKDKEEKKLFYNIEFVLK
jgi:hypothetical protein